MVVSMMSKAVKTLLMMLLATTATFAQEERAKFALNEPAPGIVSVVHLVDTNKVADKFRTQNKARVGVPGSLPPYILSVATGLAVDADGHIVTRLPYLDPTDQQQKLSVTTADGITFAAQFIGVDGASGFAILQVKGLKIELPTFLASSAVTNGEEVRIVSADYIRKDTQTPAQQEVYITPTIKLSQGQISTNSPYSKARGAMTLRSAGLLSRNDSSIITTFDNRIIGIAEYAGYSRAYLYPIELIRSTIAKRVIDQKGSVPAGWLGVTGDSLTNVPDTEFGTLGLGSRAGVIVREVRPESPAARCGLQPNDVIIGIDDLDVLGEAELLARLLSLPAGQKIRLRTIRKQQAVELEAVLGARDFEVMRNVLAQTHAQWDSPDSQRQEWKNRAQELQNQRGRYLARKDLSSAEREALREIEVEIGFLLDALSRFPAADNYGERGVREASFSLGFVVRDLSPQLAESFGAKSGVIVVGVAKSSAAERAGVKAGDVIIEAQGREVANSAQLRALLVTPQKVVVLKLLRSRQPLLVEIAATEPVKQ